LSLGHFFLFNLLLKSKILNLDKNLPLSQSYYLKYSFSILKNTSCETPNQSFLEIMKKIITTYETGVEQPLISTNNC